ncbi:polysaccharide deacetylase family protein [Tardiphaga sp.]|uniref:polysaccharide deacetylase family protein n=1 Tax=Tardiphaga sp. TaxID=1926292 RepID=UPI002602C942|nr:polysaccharide deacetylase family protein [Tardiphaga sp.]MDB5619402.1 polysaccharide deacetylase [Tardiphaga sp.]
MKHFLSGVAKQLATSEALIRPITMAADFFMSARGCLVTFHRGASAQAWEKLPNRDFYLDLDFLDQFLSYLTHRGWDVVTMEEALRRSALGRANDRFINFSIDDCYRDTFEQVVPLFRRHDLPVTLFVTTGIPDATLPLWAAGLEDVLLTHDRVMFEDGAVDVATFEDKNAAFHRVAGQWDGPHAAACYVEFCKLNDIDIDAMHWKHAISWEMLEALRDDPLVEIGAHTVSHPHVSSLTPERARAELQGSRDRLIEKLGIPCRHFAFPYGRSADCGPRDFEIARDSGFVSAATTRKGLMRSGQDAFDLPRNTINGAHRSLATMELHLTGLTGAAARMTGRV